MPRWFWAALIGLMGCLGLGLAVQSATGAAPAAMAALDQARLAGGLAKDPGDWLTAAGDWAEQRFSPLQQINDKTVGRLGLLWYADLDTYRGVEGTPLVIDGVIYNISAWDVTTAYDGVTGRKLWTFDPKVPVSWAGM